MIYNEYEYSVHAAKLLQIMAAAENPDECCMDQ